MNDLDVDKANSRKGNYVFGAKMKRQLVPVVLRSIVLSNGISLCILAWLRSERVLHLLLWFIASVAVNVFYNFRPFRLSRRYPWELVCMLVGHLLIPVLSCMVNDVPYPNCGSWAFHILLLSRSHLWLEMVDIECDRKYGKHTIAVALGRRWTYLLVQLLVFMEALVGFVWLGSATGGLFSTMGILVFTWYENHRESPSSLKAVSNVQAVLGVGFMFQLWRSGVFTR